MNVIEHLSSSLGHKDEMPNIELAKLIVKENNKAAIKELIGGLSHVAKPIQSDCIKVLYEIGTLNPLLISPYIKNLLALLTNKNNRLQWGGMAALHSITYIKHEIVFEHLPDILSAAEKGSVITRDYAVNILITLANRPSCDEQVFPILMEQLMKAPTNQLPMYAERVSSIITDKNKNIFSDILQIRLRDVQKESKRKRIEKIIRKLDRLS